MSGLLALILLKLEIHSYKVTHLVCYLQGVVSEKYVAFILNCINFSYIVFYYLNIIIIIIQPVLIMCTVLYFMLVMLVRAD